MLHKKSRLTQYKYYPWLVIALCSSLLFYKYVLSISPSIMAADLMLQFQVSGARLGSLAATFFYTYTFVQLFAGVLIDKFSTRLIAGLSTLVAALGAYVFSIADSLAWATLARGMMGFGVAFATIAYFKLTAAWFRVDQMAFVGGLIATAVMAGAVFGEAPLAWMVDHTSWRSVLLFCSILGYVIAILFLLLVRDKPDHLQHTMLQNKSTILPKAGWQEIKLTLKCRQNWLLALYSGLAFSPLSVLGGLWGNPFLQEAHHISRGASAGLASFLFIGLGLGSPLLGLLSDKLGNRLVIMKIGALGCLAMLLSIMYLPDIPIWLLGLLLFMLGFFTGTFMLGFTLGTQINPITMAGTVIALINTGDSIFESFTEPMLGKILDLSWNGQMLNGIRHFTVHDYHVAFTSLALYFVMAFVVLFFIKEPHTRY